MTEGKHSAPGAADSSAQHAAGAAPTGPTNRYEGPSRRSLPSTPSRSSRHSETPRRSRKPLVVGVVVGVLALIGIVLGVILTLNSRQSAPDADLQSSGAGPYTAEVGPYEGYEFHCGADTCIGLKDSADAVVQTASPGGTISATTREFPAGSTATTYSDGGPRGLVAVTSPGEDGTVSTWDPAREQRFALPADGALVWPPSYGVSDGFALSGSGDLWVYSASLPTQGDAAPAEPQALATPWPVTEVLTTTPYAVWVSGEPGSDGTPVALVSTGGDNTEESLIPGRVREVRFPLFLLDDGNAAVLTWGDELLVRPLDLPREAADATLAPSGFLVLLRDGSVYAPTNWDGNELPSMKKLKLPGVAVAVGGGLVRLADGTVWMPDPATPQGDALIQVELPSPTKALMGGGWVMLEDGNPAYVGEDGEVQLLGPGADG